MKKLCILAALLLALVPVTAMAGMTAASDMDLQDVSGQTGITLSMTMRVAATGFAWGDNDGFGTAYTTDGWLILRGVVLPTVSVNGLEIDAGSTANTSYLAITTTGNLITGSLTIGSVVIGSTTTDTSPSIGEIRVSGIGIGFGTILISGH